MVLVFGEPQLEPQRALFGDHLASEQQICALWGIQYGLDLIWLFYNALPSGDTGSLW